ncbi:hypothetical protein [Actinokineospora sp. UTMC 2448]|uniref:hypothetical protein n=1 Tax=Actinokineospora sp. UTMC 2448 TaxID=2268449 RepID=UPI0021647150|nr:hypothetical protein [Actinokineospora sp. UTMC 2448]UVS79553.1 hypothetical protein Actkin_03303 [Actinokineospora sp. UTMC 2448]
MTAHALSAPIIAMFHSTGSAGAEIDAPIWGSRYRWAVVAPETSVSRVCPTFCTPATARILVAKSVAAEWATTTPMGACAFWTVPPLAVTAWATAPVDPGAVITR